jgi:predicted phosphodiesterase
MYSYFNVIPAEIIKLIILTFFPINVLTLPMNAQHNTMKQVFHQNYQLTGNQQKISSGPLQFENSSTEFALEFVILDHVKSNVGFIVLNQNGKRLFQYLNDSISIAKTTVASGSKVKSYWRHVVVNYYQNGIAVFENGQQTVELKTDTITAVTELVINGIFDDEYGMQLNDMLKTFVFHPLPLLSKCVNDNFNSFKTAIQNGTLACAEPHYIVQPFLALPTTNKVNLNFETNMPSKSVVKFGKAYPLSGSFQTESEITVHQITLTGLEPSTNYYAEVETTVNGLQLPMVKLSFKTANEKAEAFRFGIIADTESRPFINTKIARHLWDNRPDFFLLLGDITDSGKKEFKDQWTLELFTGMNSLMQRVPVIPVAGNGDADLFWFNRYFNPPTNGGFYAFSWSNTNFFVLNSSKSEEFEKGGKQYDWLENELKQSTAIWNIVLMHHAPYSSDDDDFGNSWQGPTDMGEPQIRKLVPLFDKYHVDFVMFGHLHCYERSWPLKNNKIDIKNGTVYLMTGGAGGTLENFAPHRTWFNAKTFRGYHYSIANVFENTFRIDTYNIDGSLIDFYEKQK